MDQDYESSLLSRAVDQLSRLPGVGRRTALRLALHILREDPEVAHSLSTAIQELRDGVRYCRECHNISESDLCPVCAAPGRDHATVCVVANVKDVMCFEATGAYRGVYHVLGGLISPLDGVGPEKLEIDSLVQRVARGGIREIILALNPSMEGETTNYYIYQRLKNVAAIRLSDADTCNDAPPSSSPAVVITQLARGISVAGDIQYTDELTLARSLLGRTPFGASSRPNV